MRAPMRMYGGSRGPSLLLRYATYYIVHKEVVRQLFLDGFKNLLFDMKKVVYPPIPFCIGSCKFSKVKSAPYFVKNLENFHFGAKIFHRNDSKGKFVAHCALIKVNFEYSDHWDKDEEIFKNVCNMTALNKWFRQKITTIGGKGSNNTTKHQQ